LKINEEINGVLNLSQEVKLKTDRMSKTEEKSLITSFKQYLNPINSIIFCGLVLFVLLLYLISHFNLF